MDYLLMFSRIRWSVLSLVALAFAPLGIYFFAFHGPFAREHDAWGDFGSYVSGVYGSFAFMILAYTTNITRRQFKIQNEDSVFFKLYDSLQNRITSSKAVIGGTEYSGHQTLKGLVIRFHEELYAQTPALARQLLCKSPEKISDVSYRKIFEAMKGPRFIDTFTEDKNGLISAINGQPNFNARWEMLKCYFDSEGEESAPLLEALRATGSVNFYKIPFSERKHYYQVAAWNLSDQYGEFLDGYFRNACFLIEFATTASNKSLYAEFIRSQLSKYELIIVFYLAAGKLGEVRSARHFLDLCIIDALLTIDCQFLMIDLPSEEILREELSNVFGDR